MAVIGHHTRCHYRMVLNLSWPLFCMIIKIIFLYVYLNFHSFIPNAFSVNTFSTHITKNIVNKPWGRNFPFPCTSLSSASNFE